MPMQRAQAALQAAELAAQTINVELRALHAGGAGGRARAR